MFLRIYLFLTILGSILLGHQTGLSYLDIKEDTDAKIAVIYKKPLVDTQATDIFIRYPAKCSQIALKPKTIEDGFIIQKYQLWCTQTGLKDSRIWVDGLVSSDKGLLVRYEKNEIVEKALLRSTTPFIQINHKSSQWQLFVEYVELGVIHILAGYDHLLFVLGLFLLAKNMKLLLYAVTGFTLSHSITLAFGILGIVNVEIAYIEAMIALSIVFLARELAVANENSFSRRYLGVVSFIFGLLHGFGFSSVLSDIGLPQDEIALSLFSFNLGIELGQLVFITILGVFLLLFDKFTSLSKESLHRYGSYFIGSFASFWLIERVISF